MKQHPPSGLVNRFEMGASIKVISGRYESQWKGHWSARPPLNNKYANLIF